MCYRILVVILTALPITVLHAEPHDYEAVEEIKVPKLEVDHKVDSDSVTSEFEVEDSTQWNGIIQAYAGKEIFKRIEKLPGIASIQFVPGTHLVESDYHDEDVIKSSRNSSAVVRTSGQTPLTFMFKVKEQLLRCRDLASLEGETLDTWATQGWNAMKNGDEAPCRMESSLDVEGPIAVYGVVPGSFRNKLLLMNQVKLSWEIGLSYDKKDTKVKARFRTARLDFPEAVQKLVNWSVGTSPLTEILMQNPTNTALTQIGRVLKSINHEVLKEQ